MTLKQLEKLIIFSPRREQICNKIFSHKNSLSYALCYQRF